jgi:hypothetical protein
MNLFTLFIVWVPAMDDGCRFGHHFCWYCKISHLIPKVMDETMEWLRSEYYEHVFEDAGTGVMKVHRGKTHKYLGVSF